LEKSSKIVSLFDILAKENSVGGSLSQRIALSPRSSIGGGLDAIYPGQRPSQDFSDLFASQEGEALLQSFGAFCQEKENSVFAGSNLVILPDHYPGKCPVNAVRLSTFKNMQLLYQAISDETSIFKISGATAESSPHFREKILGGFMRLLLSSVGRSLLDALLKATDFILIEENSSPDSATCFKKIERFGKWIDYLQIGTGACQRDFFALFSLDGKGGQVMPAQNYPFDAVLFHELVHCLHSHQQALEGNVLSQNSSVFFFKDLEEQRTITGHLYLRPFSEALQDRPINSHCFCPYPQEYNPLNENAYLASHGHPLRLQHETYFDIWLPVSKFGSATAVAQMLQRHPNSFEIEQDAWFLLDYTLQGLNHLPWQITEEKLEVLVQAIPFPKERFASFWNMLAAHPCQSLHVPAEILQKTCLLAQSLAKKPLFSQWLIQSTFLEVDPLQYALDQRNWGLALFFIENMPIFSLSAGRQGDLLDRALLNARDLLKSATLPLSFEQSQRILESGQVIIRLSDLIHRMGSQVSPSPAEIFSRLYSQAVGWLFDLRALFPAGQQEALAFYGERVAFYFISVPNPFPSHMNL
jgi:hypothetical protein